MNGLYYIVEPLNHMLLWSSPLSVRTASHILWFSVRLPLRCDCSHFFRHLDQQVERGNTVYHMCICWSELIAVAFEANYDAGMNTETLLSVVAWLL